MRKRRRPRRPYRRNPIATQKILIAVGAVGALAAIGTVIYFATREKAPALTSKTVEGGIEGGIKGGIKGGMQPGTQPGGGTTTTAAPAGGAVVGGALFDAALAAIKKADASWAYPQDATLASWENLNYRAAYDAMVAAVQANQIGTGAMVDAAKAAVAKWQTALASNLMSDNGATQQDVEAAAKMAFDAMLAVFRVFQGPSVQELLKQNPNLFQQAFQQMFPG